MTKKREIHLFIQDIVESIDLINKYIEDLTLEEFVDNIISYDAVLRRLEIIGEASNNIPKNLKDRIKGISWTDIKGSRNILAHEYYEINPYIIWDTIKIDLPKLKKEAEKLLKFLDKQAA